VAGGIVEITGNQCESECKLVGKFSGTASGINTGFVSVFEAPYTSGDLPIANGVIKNGLWEIKDENILTDVDYILYSTKIKNLI
jgi:hypothetical protein